MKVILPHLRELNYYHRPNYSMIYKCFLNLMKRLDVQWENPYDWETEKQAKYLVIFLIL